MYEIIAAQSKRSDQTKATIHTFIVVGNANKYPEANNSIWIIKP